MGKWFDIRVPHTALQSHPQPAGALPHEPLLCPHWQVVCQTLWERREAHQQEVLWKKKFFVFNIKILIHSDVGTLLCIMVLWPQKSNCVKLLTISHLDSTYMCIMAVFMFWVYHWTSWNHLIFATSGAYGFC